MWVRSGRERPDLTHIQSSKIGCWWAPSSPRPDPGRDPDDPARAHQHQSRFDCSEPRTTRVSLPFAEAPAEAAAAEDAPDGSAKGSFGIDDRGPVFDPFAASLFTISSIGRPLNCVSLAGQEAKDMSPEAREQRKHERAKERAQRRMTMFSQLAAEIEKPEVEGFNFRYEPRSDDGTCPYSKLEHMLHTS